jgi:hypothetical protein
VKEDIKEIKRVKKEKIKIRNTLGLKKRNKI